jgi:hypothetical protein
MLMKGLVMIGAAVVLSAATSDLWASSVTGTSQAIVGQPNLLLAGPVESISEKNGTAVVLGQKLFVQLPESVVVGDSVSVYGKLQDDGTLAVSKVTNQGIYVPGASHVVLTALVQQVHASVGRAKVGGLDVDLTSINTMDGTTSVVSGSVVQVSGTQPSSHGLVLADAIVGGGVNRNAIVGGGSQPNAIVGGGASLKAIVGGGSQPNAIVGGGASLKAIVGGGSQPNAIVGGGASLKAIVGGGSQPNAIVGGGASLKAIVGGGIKPNAIVGGGH